MNNDWTNFCGWLKEYIGFDIPITWERYEHPDGNIVRIDIFKDRPFHVTTAVYDECHLNNMGTAYELARGLECVLPKAIRENRPLTYIQAFI